VWMGVCSVMTVMSLRVTPFCCMLCVSDTKHPLLWPLCWHPAPSAQMPLAGTPEQIGEVLPALMANLRMMHAMSRHYAAPARLAVLLQKIARQVCPKYCNRVSH